MAPFEENLDEFLDQSEFARSALIGTTLVVGIFTASNADVFDVEGVRPTFLVKDSSIVDASVKNGSLVNFSGDFYYVRSVQPDGTGMTLLVMEDA